MEKVQKFFEDGGNLMFVNLGVLVFSLAVVTERLVVLLARLRIDEKKFVGAVETLVLAGNFDRALKLCQQHEGAPVSKVVRAALVNARMGGAAVAAAVDETMAEVLPQVQKRAGILWGIANLATLIGLVGTVFGLIDAFGAISQADPQQKSVLLTRGISHAMNNTAFGLSIAVTCIFFHMILSNIVKNVVHGLEHSAERIKNILAKRRFETGGREPAAPAPAT